MSALVLMVVLLCIGLYGVMTRRDLIAVLACMEVSIGAACGLVTVLSGAADSVEAFLVLVLVIAASEVSVALALVVRYAKRRPPLADSLTEVRG